MQIAQGISLHPDLHPYNAHNFHCSAERCCCWWTSTAVNAFQYTTEALLWSTTVALPGLPDLYYAACSGLPGLCTRNNLLLIVPFLADFQSSTDPFVWSTTVALQYAACSGLPGLCLRNNLLLIVSFLADFQSSTDALLHAKVLAGDLRYFLSRIGALQPLQDDQHQIAPYPE